MKYIDQPTLADLDAEIERMFELSMPTSAFKKVIPAHIKIELRRQYIEFLEEQMKSQEETTNACENSRPVSTHVIKVNISSLRQAGYCICPKELAAACETLIRQQAQTNDEPKEAEKNILTDVQNIGKNATNETVESDFNCDHETTHSKSNDISSEVADLDKILQPKEKKAVQKKLGADEEFLKKSNSDKAAKSHQGRTMKRKYFTKYMSNEFSKDTDPVNMAMMDDKTQKLFREQEFNDLVSEITGML
eukprot:CAMPEP_0168345858 /NCGR_PEP_ID=MMETSP0213-20121227/17852_1 /TAXON_ID=151035 /ORGANISM="Euplotes harpa, Strain FSP1.4" /LENGTH=248 /DNA_ID=CAMNT_0008354251 /DNA_START=29 /DNA_END=775 /DNA_ORIENTATION=+